MMNSKQIPSHRYSLRLSDEENARFLTLLEQSGMKNKSDFIRHRIFDRPFRVITQDKSLLECYARLTQIHAQIRKIGVLYNQTVRAVNSYHSALTAKALLRKLEHHTLHLTTLTQESLHICQYIRELWSQK